MRRSGTSRSIVQKRRRRPIDSRQPARRRWLVSYMRSRMTDQRRATFRRPGRAMPPAGRSARAATASERDDMMLRVRGFTLIELMIALAIFAFLLMLAGPMYAQFLANSQIRNGAEAMLNGVQKAQAIAVHGNTWARLLIDPTTGTGGWQVLQTIEGSEPSPPNPIQVYTLQDGAPKTAVTTVPADAREVTFDGFGRVVLNSARDPADTTATLTCIKVTH